MIDMSATTEARALVEQQENLAREQRIAEEAFRIEHNRAMAASAQSMADAVRRNKAARLADHAAAVSVARAAKEHFTIVSDQRVKAESRLGYAMADRDEAMKRRSRCTPPDPNDFPLPAELAAFQQRCAEYDREVFRLSALIGTLDAEFDRAKFAEWEAQDALDKAASAELRLRGEPWI
jgi:hypothetical protein